MIASRTADIDRSTAACTYPQDVELTVWYNYTRRARFAVLATWTAQDGTDLQLRLSTRLLSSKVKQIRRDFAHLDLLGTLRDPVPTEMTIDVLEGVVARIAIAAVDLQSSVFACSPTDD